MGVGQIIFVCVLAYFGIGIFLSFQLFGNSYGGKHEDEKMAAMIFFWPILIIGGIIILFFKSVLSAFKGLYYMFRDTIKEDDYND